MVLRSFVDIQLIDRQDVVIQLIDRQDVVIQIHQDYEGYLLTPEGACHTPPLEAGGLRRRRHFRSFFRHFRSFFRHFRSFFRHFRSFYRHFRGRQFGCQHWNVAPNLCNVEME
jgi:hypothetical protein